MAHEAARVVIERDGAVERVTSDVDVPRLRAPRRTLERQVRLDEARLRQLAHALFADLLEMREHIVEALPCSKRSPIPLEQIDDVLHPGCAAFRIRSNEDVAG